MTTVEARENFSELLNKAAYGKERVVLSRRGKGIVAVIPLEDLKLLEEIEDMVDLADAKKALKEVKKSGTISLEEFKKKLKKE